jgi:hypothetical protein
MRPKGKLFALVVLFAAVGLLTATGAFTTVEADREADVTAEGDANALLAMEPHQNSEFATIEDDQIKISLNDSNGGVQSETTGVNLNATTLDDNVLNITNNGEENIELEINVDTKNGAEIVFYNATGQHQDSWAGSYNNTDNAQTLSELQLTTPSEANTVDGTNRIAINDSSARPVLTSGETIVVGIYIETYGLSDGQAIFADSDAITITAEESDPGS